MKLITMREFVFHLRNMTTSELCITYPQAFKTPVWNGNQSEMVKDMLAIDAIQWRLVGEYAKFLSRPLKIGMFVPADEKGQVLIEPSSLLGDYEEDLVDAVIDRRYSLAKAEVLFEGFEMYEGNPYNYHKARAVTYDWLSEGYDIERIVHWNLSLSASAIKSIFG